MNFRDKKRDCMITCPRCGAEYLPAEIFIPDMFFGKPEDIDKTSAGKIEAYDGTSMCTVEDYTCDLCGAELEIRASISFKAVEKSEAFEEVYTTTIRPEKISLFEDL